MLNTVKQYLTEKDWEFSEIKDKSIILFGITGKNGNFQCVVDIFDEEKQFVFYSICGVNVPLDKQYEILSLINKINYTSFLGNLEMNKEDGEIRYKTTISYKFLQPNNEIVDQLIMLNIISLDKCLIGINGILFNGINNESAIELIELGESS